MQLEWAKQVYEFTGKPVIILVPLAVAGQTIEQAQTFGYGHLIGNKIKVLNYDLLDIINESEYSGVVLDESSILKNFEGKTKQQLIEKFKNYQYKLCCTATPSPNDDMEICNHAEFLGHGQRSEILAMYFTHDGGETSKWRLKGHAIDTFWKWVSSWSILVTNPSDIGFDGSSYILPKLNMEEIEIKTEVKGLTLFNDKVVSATNFNQELRETMEARLIKTAEIVNSKNEPFIIWIKQDIEGDYLKKLIPDAVEVRGSDSKELKEKRLLGFARGEFRVLITKTKIAQFGLNYQNCNNQIFPSLDFSFESLYQAIRRSYRFGQKNEVNIYVLRIDTMSNVIQSIGRKNNQFEEMKTKMLKYQNAA